MAKHNKKVNTIFNRIIEKCRSIYYWWFGYTPLYYEPYNYRVVYIKKAELDAELCAFDQEDKNDNILQVVKKPEPYISPIFKSHINKED